MIRSKKFNKWGQCLIIKIKKKQVVIFINVIITTILLFDVASFDFLIHAFRTFNTIIPSFILYCSIMKGLC